MRTRLLAVLIALLAAVLLALGFPLAASIAAAEQQNAVVDRIDDTARFASLAQYVTARPPAGSPTTAEARKRDKRLATLYDELERYHDL